MHVIHYAVDDENGASVVLDDSAHVGEERFPDLGRQQRGTVFGRENEVIEEEGVRVRHEDAAQLSDPCRGLDDVEPVSPG